MAHQSTDTFTSIYKSGELNTIKKGYWSHPSIGYLTYKSVEQTPITNYVPCSDTFLYNGTEQQ